ncbi:MAG TPA: metalloregulator ArsR/SmtB family transcription factor [Terriglobia bacterium]|jgi:ArsR family transcriptional regulator|nr:metalloregulator ArsR/SmtB family transcription factor [Terriglobia bacterium]
MSTQLTPLSGSGVTVRDLAEKFRALADPSRLRILNILSHQCMCVCDLQTVLGFSQAHISRHLAYLRHAGLVQDRRGGTWVCYSPVFEGPYGAALEPLIQQLLPLTPPFQADLEKLRRSESLGEIRHCAALNGSDGRLRPSKQERAI